MPESAGARRGAPPASPHDRAARSSPTTRRNPAPGHRRTRCGDGAPGASPRRTTRTRLSSQNGYRSTVGGSISSTATPISAAPDAISCAMSTLSRSSTSMLMAGCSARKLASAFGKCSDSPDVLARIRTLARRPRAKPSRSPLHRLDLAQDQPRMVEQALAGRGRRHAAAVAREQRHAHRSFEPLDAFAGRRQRQMHARGAMGDAARFGDSDEQFQVDQIEMHGPRHAFGICRRQSPEAPDCARRRTRSMSAHAGTRRRRHRRRVRARGLRQGRARPRAADRLDGPAGGGDDAGPGRGDAGGAVARDEFLADGRRALTSGPSSNGSAACWPPPASAPGSAPAG